MRGLRAALADAAAAVELLPGAIRWFGSVEAVPPDRASVRAALQERLYTDFSCRGGAAPSEPRDPDRPSPPPPPAPDDGRRSAQAGWLVRDRRPGGGATLRRAGLTVIAGPGEWEPEAGGHGAVLLLPPHMPGLVPGYRLLLGRRDLDGRITTRAMRAYLHATPRGADLLTGRIAGALDAAGIPFRMKILRRPAAFLRCDAAVLYARTEDAPQVVETLRRLYPDLRGALRAPTPPMTLRLAPGLAWAEDPGDLDSFGHHRCGILAEGLVRAAELGERGVRARVRRMERAMAEAGLDPARPYLEPGSSWAPAPFA